MSEHLISPADAASDLLACAAFIAESIQSRDGQAQAMIAVVPQYLAKGDVDTAAELANTVEDPFVRDRLLIAVAEKCAAMDDDEYALQLAEAIEDFGLQSQAREHDRASDGGTRRGRKGTQRRPTLLDIAMLCWRELRRNSTLTETRRRQCIPLTRSSWRARRSRLC